MERVFLNSESTSQAFGGNSSWKGESWKSLKSLKTPEQGQGIPIIGDIRGYSGDIPGFILEQQDLDMDQPHPFGGKRNSRLSWRKIWEVLGLVQKKGFGIDWAGGGEEQG